ncbi:MAG TPA: UPF0175 family protein [Anaerolineales bacterium]|nr:UPF0175 family protein [Anaerolineales bacterium]
MPKNPKLKQTGSLQRKYPDLAEVFENLDKSEKPEEAFENFDKEPLAKVEAPIWREIRIMVAAKLYGSGSMSSERAAKLAGLPHVEFLLNLGFYKIFPLQAELTELESSND